MCIYIKKIPTSILDWGFEGIWDSIFCCILNVVIVNNDEPGIHLYFPG